MAVLPPKILRFRMTQTTVHAVYSGTGAWVGYPYQWATTLLITPQPHGSPDTPTPYFYDGNDVVVGDYIVASGRGRILKIVTIFGASSTSINCVVEDENRQNIFLDETTSGDGGIPDGEGLLFSAKNGLPILHPLPDSLAGSLPPYFASDITARFFNTFSSTISTYAPIENPTFAGQVRIPLGSGAAGSYVAGLAFVNDPNTGLSQIGGADSFSVVAGGTERIRIDNTGVGVTDTYSAETGAVYGFRSDINVSATNTATFAFLAAGNAPSQFNGQIRVGSGGSAAPAIANRSITNTGVDLSDAVVLVTSGADRLRVRTDGGISLGSSGSSNVGLFHQYTLSSSATRYGEFVQPTLSAASSSSVVLVVAAPILQDNATTASCACFQAGGATLGTGAAITDMYGLLVGNNFTQGANNYAAYLNITNGTGRWNLYCAGTAPNLMAGQLQMAAGSVGIPSVSFSDDPNTGIAQLGGADTWSVSTGGAEQLRVDALGNTNFYKFFGLSAGAFTRHSAPVINAATRLAGRPINFNPQFLGGLTAGWFVYNNAGGTAVTHTLVDEATLQNNIPNASGRALEITYNGTGSVSPGVGGFYLGSTLSAGNAQIDAHNRYRAGQRLVYRIVAKIPSNCQLTFATNAYGTGGGVAWRGPVAGTDQWEEYCFVQQIGFGGTFSSTGYFYLTRLSGSGVVTWHVASCQLIDMDSPPEIHQTAGLSVGYDSEYAAAALPNFGFGSLAVANNALIKNRVGVGTNDPGYPLVVRDSAATAATVATNIIGRLQANASGADVNLQFSDGVTNAAHLGMVGGALYAHCGGAERLRILTNGNIGVGATQPTAKLSFGNYYIASNTPTPSETVSHIKLYDSNAVQYGLGVSNFALNIAAHQSGASIRLHTADAERMRIDGDGNVSIRSTGSVNNLPLNVEGGVTLRPKNRNGSLHAYVTSTHLNVAAFCGAVSEVGVIALRLPVVPSGGNGGLRFRIRGLEMSTGSTTKTTWALDYTVYLNSGAYVSGANAATFQGLPPFFRVRIMDDGTYKYLFLGETTTRWSYPLLTLDVDVFWSGERNLDVNTCTWSVVTNEAGYSLFHASHTLPIDNVFPVSGNVGIGTAAPTSGLVVARDGGTGATVTELQLLRPSSTGTNAAKISGNDQELLFSFGLTGTDSTGARIWHRSWEPAATPTSMSWGGALVSLWGEADGDNHGTSVSVNADGNRIVVGGPFNTRGGTRTSCGFVRVYQYSPAPRAAWVTMALDIDGDAENDQSGYSVGMSADGNAVIIGAPGHSADRGQVRVFDYTGATGTGSVQWVLRGTPFVGTQGDDPAVNNDYGGKLGFSVDMSADGNRIVFSEPNFGANTGQVQVWEWSAGAGAWSQMGATISSPNFRTQFGKQVCISRQGNRIAISDDGGLFTGNQPGNVRVYDWTGTEWVQLGQTLVGASGSLFGFESVALSADGSRIVVGGPDDDTDGLTNRGYVQVYQWDNVSSWVQLGNTLYGDAANRRFGHDVDINDAGTRIVVGAPGRLPISCGPFGGPCPPDPTDTGYVYAYELVGGTWTQIGATISPTSAGGTTFGGFLTGYAVAISGDGKTLVYGEPKGTLTASGVDQTHRGRAVAHRLTEGTQANRNYLWMSDTSVSIRNAGNNGVLYADTVNNRVGVMVVPTAPLDINGNTLRLRSARTPASATAAGSVGEICWDANYVYVCVATNQWRRSPLAAW